MRVRTADLFLWILFVPLAGYATSFDCTKATSQVERLICSDGELSKLDDEMAFAYRTASAAPATGNRVREGQRKWLAERNSCNESACIKSTYSRRLAELRAEARSPNPAQTSSGVDEQAPAVRAIRSLQFKHADTPWRIDAGRVIFSHYDKSGNTKNIVAIDIPDGSIRNLAEGEREAQFVAESQRYLVYSAAGANANPLIVIDKRTRERVASVRLRSPISWGHVEGSRLLVAQVLGNTKATILVYRLPDLKLERTNEITGGAHFAFWGDKIVSLGYKLSIHDRDFKEIAVVGMPAAVPNLGSSCSPGPLRISGDKAVIGSNCRQLAVIDLPSASIERTILTESNFQSFDISEGLLFTTDPSGDAPNTRVIDLASGRELSRLNLDATFLALQGKSLLALKRMGWLDPLDATLYEVNFSAIRSEEDRIARTLSGCRAADSALKATGDLHAALQTCETAGILGYVEITDISSDLRESVERYAHWLTLSLSRYSEGLAILEHLQRAKPDMRIASQIASTKRKAGYLDLPPKEAKSSQIPDRKGVSRASINFGSFSNLLQFDEDKLYVGRWDCERSGDPGVTLDVRDRKTFNFSERVVIAHCDDNQQDSISTIAIVPGYIVLGLEYRYEEEGRPTVAIVDARTLKVEKRAFVKQPINTLRKWKNRLLDCTSNQVNRFDPASARYVAATKDEARACINGDPMDRLPGAADLNDPMAQTALYRVYADRRPSDTRLRLTKKSTGASTVTRAYKQGFGVLAVPNREALVLQYSDGKYVRFAYYDIEAETYVVLFELNTQRRDVRYTSWSRFLLVTMGRDLLVYDLDRRKVIDYDKDFIRDGFLNNCCGVDRNGIHQLLLDGDRLIVLTFDGGNSRIIDLPTYTGALSAKDFFQAAEGR